MRLVMMGTGLFAEPTFEAILAGSHAVVGLVTQPDRATGAARGSTRQTGKGMKAIALERGLPVLQPESINTAEGVAALRELTPDLLVVAAYGQILSREVLSVPPHGGINVHASLLPRFRGAAPIAWAIAQGEKRTGVTIIRMTVGLDAGEMLAQAEVEIGAEETAGELEARLAPLGAQLATTVIDQLAAGTAVGVRQDASLVSRAPKLKKEDGALDWSQPAATVCARVRAMQPWPTAYTAWHRDGQPSLRLIICRAMSVADIHAGEAIPGTILTGFGQHLVVATGNGLVEILELQPAGKKRMSAEAFLRGRPVRPGDRLGPESQ